MAQREKELCIGRKKFNMDPMKVGSAGARAGGPRKLHAGHLHSLSFFPSTDTITYFPEEETEAPLGSASCPVPHAIRAGGSPTLQPSSPGA